MPELTYLLTPWCRVLLEKVTGLQLVKKFPAFHGTRRFITALTSVRQLSLSWARPIQSIYPHPTSWRSILILSTHLRLGLHCGLLPSGFPTKTLYTPFSSPIRATCLAHLILLDFITSACIPSCHKSWTRTWALIRTANQLRTPGLRCQCTMGGRCVWLTNLPPSCADCLSRSVMGLLYLYLCGCEPLRHFPLSSGRCVVQDWSFGIWQLIVWAADFSE